MTVRLQVSISIYLFIHIHAFNCQGPHPHLYKEIIIYVITVNLYLWFYLENLSTTKIFFKSVSLDCRVMGDFPCWRRSCAAWRCCRCRPGSWCGRGPHITGKKIIIIQYTKFLCGNAKISTIFYDKYCSTSFWWINLKIVLNYKWLSETLTCTFHWGTDRGG